MTKIIDNLYIGNFDDARDKYYDVIINLSGEHLDFSDIKNNSCMIFNIPMDDEESFPINKYFDYTFCMIELSLIKKYKTLINCHMGISRSASIVIAYLMRKKNLSYYDAYDFVKSKRKIINPNYGFEKKLIKYT